MRYEPASRTGGRIGKGKARIPDELWSAAVEVARRDGVNQTAAALHLDGGKLKRRMMATGSVPDKAMPPAFVEMMVPQPVGCVGVHDRTGRPERQDANPVEGCHGSGPGRSEPGVVGRGVVIQIAPQIRILVAIEAIDGRKGIDRIAQLCREKLNADPFSGYLFIFRSRRGTSIRILAVRRPGVLAGDEAIVQRAFQVVADRRRSRAGVAGAPGAVAAGGGQPGDRSGARVAEGELNTKTACVLIFLLACCGYGGNVALPRAGDLPASRSRF